MAVECQQNQLVVEHPIMDGCLGASLALLIDCAPDLLNPALPLVLERGSHECGNVTCCKFDQSSCRLRGSEVTSDKSESDWGVYLPSIYVHARESAVQTLCLALRIFLSHKITSTEKSGPFMSVV